MDAHLFMCFKKHFKCFASLCNIMRNNLKKNLQSYQEEKWERLPFCLILKYNFLIPEGAKIIGLNKYMPV